MSLQLINQYQTKLERIIAYGGSRNEGSVRAAFQELLDRYASSKNLALVTELDYKTNFGTTVRPDGTLKNYETVYGMQADFEMRLTRPTSSALV